MHKFKKELVLANRVFFITVLLFYSITAVFYAVFLYLKYEQYKSDFQDESKLHLIKKNSEIKVEFGSIKRSLTIIENISIQMAPDIKSKNEFLEHISQHFKVFMNDNVDYLQLRVLDVDGKEIVRVDNKLGKSYIISNLQDKSNRYYYQEATKLQKNEFYVSPLDLNIEHGQIEIPRVPVIRFAKQIFIDGEKFGYLVLNYNMEKFLDDIKETEHYIETLLLNKEGFYLSGFEEKDEFGFMFNNDKLNFANTFANIWTKMNSNKNGQVEFAQNIGVYEKYNPIEMINSNRGIKGSFEWILVVYFDTDFIYERLLDDYKNNQILLYTILLFVLVFSYVFSYLIISIQKKEEQLLEQSRLAQMGEMISMIAHQWRQPLGIISMGVNNILLDLELDSLDNNTLKNDANNILNTTEELSKTIDNFGNLYKSNEQPVIIKLEDVIKKSLTIIKPSLINNNINIIEEYNNSNKEIELYDGAIMQVILNILRNAQDNFKEQETKNPEIRIGCKSSSDDKIILEICNNGGGIPKDILPKIFHPYFSTKDEKNGTGLGLYMSKMIIEEQHNGRLLVNNHDNGVCFTIELINGNIVK